ncbi:MAG: hypothetical protein ACRDMY_05040 [Gaiellaceae bacterium]
MQRFMFAVVAPMALVLAACGTDRPSAGGAETTTREQPPVASDPNQGSPHEGNGTVCDDETSGPMLWLGGFRLMIEAPPTCGGIPLLNWHWGAVDGESSKRGTTWGSYHVVGAYDGETLAVTEAGPYQDDPSVFGTDPDTSSPCEKPAGGWVVPDPARNTQNDVSRAGTNARSQPDYVASWNTHLEPERFEFGSVIFNAVFAGDAGRHEAEIRKVWEGPLCVVARDAPTARELERIRKEVEASLDGLALEMLWSSGPGIEPVIEIGVVADIGGKGQAALDRRYGPGLVQLIPALKPVS